MLEGLNKAMPENEAVVARLRLLSSIENLGHIAQTPLCYAWHNEMTPEIRQLLEKHDPKLFVLMDDHVALSGFNLNEMWKTFKPSVKNGLWKVLHNLTKYSDALSKNTSIEEHQESDNSKEQLNKMMDMVSDVKGIEVDRAKLYIGIDLPTLMCENSDKMELMFNMLRNMLEENQSDAKSLAACQALQGVWDQLGGKGGSGGPAAGGAACGGGGATAALDF